MSRTLHQRPFSTLRHQRVQNRRKAEAAALDALLEEQLKMRHINRLQSFMSQIVNPWDDYYISSWREFHNKNWNKQQYLKRK